MRKSVIASCIVLLSLLSACSQKAAAPARPPAAVTPAAAASVAVPSVRPVSNDTLMKAVYGGSWYPSNHEAAVLMPESADREKSQPFVVTALAQSTLNTGETVLVTSGEPSDDEGNAMHVFANSGLLSVYLLRQIDGAWTVVKRHDSVKMMGSDGKIGKAMWVALGKDKPGLAILHGTDQQGFIEFLSLFDLHADVMEDLTDGHLMTQSSNEASCNPDGNDDCFTTIGKWKLVPSRTVGALNDIAFTFDHEVSSRITDAAGKPTEFRQRKKTKVAARYAFDGKHYQLVSGTNSVRGF